MLIKRTPIFLLAFIAAAFAKEIVPAVPALSGGCYQISTAEELYGFAEIVNGNDSVPANESACAILQNDIVVNDSLVNGWDWDSKKEDELIPWTRINRFSGTFDGNGHVISGLFSSDLVGIFYELYASDEHSTVIKNLGIENVYFSSDEGRMGNLAQYVNGDGASVVQVTNVYVRSSTMRALGRNTTMGSIIGYVGNQGILRMNNCYSSAILSKDRATPNQLVGSAIDKISTVSLENCYRITRKGGYDDSYSYYGKLMDSSAFYNGVVTFLLREGKDGAIWGQDVGNDSFPNFSGTFKNSIAGRYNVTFHTFDGDTAKYFDNYIAGLTTELPNGTSRENLLFGGWYRDEEFTGKYDTVISNKTTGNLEYWAKMYDRYKVIYHSNGAVWDTVFSRTCGDLIVGIRGWTILTDSVDCYLGGIGSGLANHFHRDSSIFLGWYDNEELTGNRVYSITTSDKGDKEFYAKWYELKRPAIDPADSCYEISDAAELYGFAALANGEFTRYGEWPEHVCGKLTKDIVLNEKVLKDDGTLDSARASAFMKWPGIGIRSGLFDGQGHKISGLYSEETGLFGYAGIKYSTTVFVVRNLKIEDSFISSESYVGGVVNNVPRLGNLYLENVHIDGAVYGWRYVGGLVGISEGNLVVKNSGHRGIIGATDKADVGGIVGLNWEHLYIVQSYNEGLIIDMDGYSVMGGLIGEFSRYAVVVNSYNTANFIDVEEDGGSIGGLLGGYRRDRHNEAMYDVSQAFFLNNYNMGTFGNQQPARMNRREVIFENDYYISGTLPDDTTGVAVPASAFVDGTVAKALHDYVQKDADGVELAGGDYGANWIQGDEYPVLTGSETRDIAWLSNYPSGYILFYTPGQELPLPTPTFSDYTFLGWRLDGAEVTKIPSTASGILEMRAQWDYTSKVSSSSVASSSSEVASSSSSEVKSSSSTANSSSSADGKSSSSKGKDAIVAMGIAPQFSLMTVGRSIQISAARVGAAYAVFDMQGGIVMQGRVAAANFSLDMPRSTTYLVRIGSQVQKVTLK